MEPPAQEDKKVTYAVVTADCPDFFSFASALNKLGCHPIEFIYSNKEVNELSLDSSSRSISPNVDLNRLLEELIQLVSNDRYTEMEPLKPKKTVRQVIEDRMRLVDVHFPRRVFKRPLELSSNNLINPPTSYTEISSNETGTPELGKTLKYVISRHSKTSTDSSDESTTNKPYDPFEGGGFILCKLCDGGINSNRKSNLMNHVRRHSIHKQYRCLYCIYQHNEMTKVRAHMANNHRDTLSCPIDMWTELMQMTWESLMVKCFPDYVAKEQNKGRVVTPERQSPVPHPVPPVPGLPVLPSVPPKQITTTSPATPTPTSKEVKKEILEEEDQSNGDKQEKPFADPLELLADDELSAGMTPVIDMDRTNLTENMMPCLLCGKILDFTNKTTLCSLMAHAKRHYHIKQFECGHCGYASSEAAHVRTHLQHHHHSSEKPIDHNSGTMQLAWTLVMKKCFPELSDRIDNFKFKSGKPHLEERYRKPVRNDVKPEVKPPTHCYATRRNTSLTR